MFRKSMISLLAIAAVTAATMGTATLAQQGNPPAEAGQGNGPGPMAGMMDHDDMMGGPGRMDQGDGPMFGGPMGGGMEIDFVAIDTDKDGKITETEFAAWRSARVTALDADKDGKLSASEIAAARIAEVSAMIEARTAQMVTMMDSDGDGLLSAAELAERPMPVMIFQRLDTDGDGAVSQAELDAGQARMAGRMQGRGFGKGHDHGEGQGRGHRGMGQGDGMGQGGGWWGWGN